MGDATSRSLRPLGVRHVEHWECTERFAIRGVLVPRKSQTTCVRSCRTLGVLGRGRDAPEGEGEISKGKVLVRL